MVGSGGRRDDGAAAGGEDADPHDPVIEAAVRSLVASRGCSPRRALGILVDHSTRTGRPVVEEARRLVAHDARRGAPLVVYEDEPTEREPAAVADIAVVGGVVVELAAAPDVVVGAAVASDAVVPGEPDPEVDPAGDSA